MSESVSEFELFDRQSTSDSSIPSMTTSIERELYYFVARHAYQSRGLVYEVGPWLGGTTYEICRGLDETSNAWTLTVIDRFLWNDAYERKAPIGLEAGGNFKQAFLDNLARYRSHLTPIEATIADLRSSPHPGGTLELLFVDAPKSWKTMAQLCAQFLPKLLPDAAVVFQDFLHIPSQEMAWLLFSLPGVEPWLLASEGCTATFRVRQPVPADLPLFSRRFRDLTVADVERAWGRIREAVPESHVSGLHLSMGGMLWERDQHREAVRHLESASYEQSFVTNALRQLAAAIAGATPAARAKYEFLADHLRRRASADTPA